MSISKNDPKKENARRVVACSHLEDAASSQDPTTVYSPWLLKFGKCYQSNVTSREFSILLENPFDGRSRQPEDPEGITYFSLNVYKISSALIFNT